LGKVKHCGGRELKKLTSIEDEEAATVANHQRVGLGGIERQLRVVRGDMCDLGEGDNRQREATVKNDQKSTHLTNPSKNWNSACSALAA
jgi:hypothetical protein